MLSYKPTRRLLTYASYSRGYKAGGFNLDRSALFRASSPTGVPPLSGSGSICVSRDPVQLLRHRSVGPGPAVQAGNQRRDRSWRSSTMARWIDMNVALFHQLFRNFQLNTFNGLNFIVENINSCSTSLHGAGHRQQSTDRRLQRRDPRRRKRQGFELEAFTRPMPDLSINSGVTMADARYRTNLVGEWAADYERSVPAAGTAHLERAEVDRHWIGSVDSANRRRGAARPAVRRFPLHERVQHRLRPRYREDSRRRSRPSMPAIGVHGPDDSWAIEIWAQNLFDKNFMQVAFDAPVQGSGTTRGASKRASARRSLTPRRSSTVRSWASRGRSA